MDFNRVKGMRDFLPTDKIVREEIITKIKSVFKRYGFVPIETPVLEKWETLSAKFAGGAAILNETYNFKDKAGRMLGLRYDLTVPLGRVFAMNPNLPTPFKRYCIDKVWRYEEAKTGRYREFYQCDVDIIGTESLLADAECLAIAIDMFKTLGFKNYIIKINNRKILSAIIKHIGIKQKIEQVFREIDKLDKMIVEEVSKNLHELGIEPEKVQKILKIISVKGEPDWVLKSIKKELGDNKGIEELHKLLTYAKSMGFYKNVELDLSLVRGLGFYTGNLFEAKAIDSKMTFSIAGGGRWDNMIGKFEGKGRMIPAVGISFGIDRIINVMRERKMVKELKTFTKVMVTHIEMEEEAIMIAQDLRNEDINTEIDMSGKKLSKVFKYADKISIPYMVIVGERDWPKITLRDMHTGEEEKIMPKDLPAKLKT